MGWGGGGGRHVAMIWDWLHETALTVGLSVESVCVCVQVAIYSGRDRQKTLRNQDHREPN